MADFTHKDPKKRKQTAAILIAAACVVCIIGLFFLNTGSLTFDFDFFSKEPKETEQVVYTGNGKHRISLYDPDWESDIFENREWLSKNRWLTYAEGGMSLTLVDEDYASYGDAVVMFADYFLALMKGDAEWVNSFYTDSYFETHDRYTAITMQKIYDMKVEIIEQKDNGNTITYIYRVTYKIMENDGTFRNDMVSDAERAQYYYLTDDGNHVQIYDVSYGYTQLS